VKDGRILSIVIITRDTKDLLGDLLRSVEKDISLKPILREVVVVDNGSSDGTDRMVAEEFPLVVLVRNEENQGFAASANSGSRASTGDFLLFLNSDTLLIEDEILKIIDYMRENEDVGICGPQLVYPDMRLQRSSAGIPGLVSEIIPISLSDSLSSRKCAGRVRKAGEGSPAAEEKRGGENAREVDSLIGAAIMVRREAYEKTGGFDERFFFFLEETDLCMRIRKAGFRLVMLPGAKVIHLQGKTVRRNWVRGRVEYNISMYKFIRKHYPATHYRVFQAVRLTKTIGFLIVLTFLPFLLVGRRARRTYAYYSALVRWHAKGCPDDAGLKALS
jgi:N-acetylglucosaminyl-diphospho-decaprenol L-rhamnosyltransferase